MSKTKTFDDIDEKQATQAEVAKTDPQLPSTHVGEAQQFSSEDVNVEQIKIYGKSSQFEPEGRPDFGTICFNKEFPLVGEDEPLNFILVHARKYHKENFPYGSDQRPRFANTPAEVAEIERTTTTSERPKLVPVVEVIGLLERPESFTDDDAASSIFIYPFGGKEFALVKYTVQKAQAVRENYGTINTVGMLRRKQGVDANAYFFELVSREKGAGTPNKWHQFVLRASTKKAPEDAVEFIKALKTGDADLEGSPDDE